jgi:hypothetical protein
MLLVCLVMLMNSYRPDTQSYWIFGPMWLLPAHWVDKIVLFGQKKSSN